jgi:hypothetical protein
VGNGSKVSFWQDVWCGVLPFKGVYSKLFSIANLKDASEVDHLQFSNGCPRWNVNFVRTAND